MAETVTKPVAPTPAAKPKAARVVPQNDRAEEGLLRYRVRADMRGVNVKYVLAPDQAAAEVEYRKLYNLPATQALVVALMPD